VPVANAGSDVVVTLGNAANVDGLGSVDPDQSPGALTYAWTITDVPANSAINSSALSGATSATASFTPDVSGTYGLSLEVSDGVNIDQDTVTVTANEPEPGSGGYANLIMQIDELIALVEAADSDAFVSEGKRRRIIKKLGRISTLLESEDRVTALFKLFKLYYFVGSCRSRWAWYRSISDCTLSADVKLRISTIYSALLRL